MLNWDSISDEAHRQYKLYPTDGVASQRSIWESFKARISDKLYQQIVDCGGWLYDDWARVHRHDNPIIMRLFHELEAFDLHRYSGTYIGACEYMKRHGYSGIYWQNGLW